MKPLVHRVLNLALLCALGAFVSPPAVAASPIPDFKATDGNRDGVVNLEEFQAQGGLEQSFAEGDTNQDKVLSRDEFARAAVSNDRLQAGATKKGP